MAATITFTACSYTPPDDDVPTPDGPALPEVFFDTAATPADESVKLLRIKVKLSEPSTSTVDFSVGGNATLVSDFNFATGSSTGTLTFAGDEQFIELTFSDDNMEEPDETIVLTLENPQGATLGDQVTHVVTISSDILPRVSFAASATNRDEDTAGATLDLKLDIPPTAPVSVDLVLGGAATAVTDYGLEAQTVTFGIGQQTAQLDFEIEPDLRDELDEIITVDLAVPVGLVIDSTAAHTEHTIKDDDATPTAFFVNQANTQGEAVANANQIVKLSAPSNLPITVDYAITGGTAAANDVTFTAGTLTFAPGDDEETVPIAIVNDNRHETASETVQIMLSNPNANVTIPAGTAVHTLTITDNDAAPTLSFSATPTAVTEGGPAFNVTVSLVGATDLTAKVDFSAIGTSTATEPGDYTIGNPTNTLTFDPGVTAQNIAITLTNDGVGEADETINFALSNFVESSVGANGTHTVTITDDDCLGSGAFKVCPASAPNGNKNLSGAFNTDNNSNCEAQQPAGWIAQGQPASCFVMANNITVLNAGLQVTGSRPLVLVAATQITVSGVLDASANGITNGPAGPSTLCKTPGAAAESSADGGGGGAGASFMTKGGDGGDGDNSNNNADGSNAPGADAADPVILRGGCAGASGGTGPGEAGLGGGAGGAVYLVAPAITIAGTIDVSGSGGLGGAADAGAGGGGGAGGTMFLDATTTLTFSGTLMSNGGGGGQGADNNTTGQNGFDPVSATAAAAGGNTGGAGGRGGNGMFTAAAAASPTAATAGSDGGSNQGAGGGGGGGGFIKSTKSLAGGTVSAGKIVQN